MIVPLLALLALLPCARLQDDTPAVAAPVSEDCVVAPAVSARIDAWNSAESQWEQRVRGLRGAERREARKQDPAAEFVASFEELAAAGHGRALLWLARHVDRLDLRISERRERERDLWRRVVSGNAGCDWLVEAVPELPRRARVLGDDQVRHLLQAVAGGPGSENLRATAQFELARWIEKHDGPDAARAVFAELVERFPGTDAAETAAERMYFLEHLCIGCTAPDFEGEDVDGNPIRLADHRGKIVLIDFWGLWCKPCVEELPTVAALWKRHREGPFVALGIDTDDDPDRYRERAPELGVTWPNLFQGSPAGEVTEAYRVRAFPATFVLDERGVIRHSGLRGKDLERAVDELVAELSARQ